MWVEWQYLMFVSHPGLEADRDITREPLARASISQLSREKSGERYPQLISLVLT